MPSPSLPPDQGGTPHSEHVDAIEFDLEHGLTNPSTSGIVTWRALVTPYSPGLSTPLPTAVFEARSLVALPQVLTMRASYSTKTGVLTATGRLVSVGRPRGDVNVHFLTYTKADYSDQKAYGVTKTKANGTFVFKRKVARKSALQRFYLDAYVNFYIGDCTDPPIVVAGCAEESISPPPDRIKAVTIPKKR